MSPFVEALSTWGFCDGGERMDWGEGERRERGATERARGGEGEGATKGRIVRKRAEGGGCRVE